MAKNKIEATIKTILVLVLVAANFFNLFYSWRKISYPFDIDFGEGWVLDNSHKVAKEEKLYFDNPSLNFHKITAAYPPVYYLITGLLIKYLGLNFLGGRLISCLSIYLSALLIFLILFKLTKNRSFSLMIALMFPLLFPISYFGSLMRVDSLGLFFSLLALFLIIQENKLLFYLSPVFLGLAFFTKYNFASLAIPVFLIFVKTRKSKWFLYLLEFSFLVIIAFIFINRATNNAFFLNTVSFLGAAPYSLKLATEFILYFFLSYSFISLAIIYFFLTIKQQKQSHKENLIFFYFLTQSLLVFSIGKAGSDTNYFFELSAAVLLVLGLILGKKSLSENRQRPMASNLAFIIVLFLAWVLSYYFFGEIFYKLLIFFLSVIFFFLLISMSRWGQNTLRLAITILTVLQVLTLFFKPLSLRGEKFGPVWLDKKIFARQEHDQKIFKILKNNPGPALSFVSGFLVLSEKSGLFEYFILNNLYDQGIFNPEGFLDNIAKKQYSVIIMPLNYKRHYEQIEITGDESAFYKRSVFIKAVVNNYEISQETGPFLILFPK